MQVNGQTCQDPTFAQLDWVKQDPDRYLQIQTDGDGHWDIVKRTEGDYAHGQGWIIATEETIDLNEVTENIINILSMDEY